MTTMTKHKPYPFQVENIRLGMSRHVLIADDMGLGKTLSAIEIGKHTIRFPEMPWRGLVVCSKGLRAQWVNEIANQDPTQDIYIVEIGQYINPESSGWFVMHYESLVAHPPTHVVWDFVVCDEAHRIKNRKTLRSKAIKTLTSLRRVALSGTPMDKDPSELWSVLNWLYPGEFTSYWKFKNRYCEQGLNYAGYPVILGPANLEELSAKLRGRFIRHTKEQVAKDMPPKVFIPTVLEMDSRQLSLYESIRNAKDIEVVTAEGKLIVPNALAKIVRLQQVASAPLSLGDEWASTPSVKVDWVMEFLEDNPTPRVVVFAKFVKTAKEIADRLGPEATTFIGSDSLPLDYLGGKTRILVATIAKGGEGLDLKDTDAAIFIDQEWSSIRMQQAYDRIHRLGAKAPKMIYMLQCSPVDVLIQDAIDKKFDDVQFVYQALERSIL
jgi:SNF2 family DNA or RNA helicase